MTRPDDIPEDVWEAARRAIEPWLGPGSQYRDDCHEGIAYAILAERARCSEGVRRANVRVAGIEVPAMRGDNLAVTLCTSFDDDGEVDDYGWSAAAVAGYEETIEAIRAHYTAAIAP